MKFAKQPFLVLMGALALGAALLLAPPALGAKPKTGTISGTVEQLAREFSLVTTLERG